MRLLTRFLLSNWLININISHVKYRIATISNYNCIVEATNKGLTIIGKKN